MLRIRLTRTGKKKQPSYRIVVVPRKWKRDGKYVANIGHYNPTAKPKVIKIDKQAYQDWLKKGAQPSLTVQRLYNQAK
jgi:small subunit ribosomal protein S16